MTAPILYYAYAGPAGEPKPALAPSYELRTWKPSLLSVRPQGFSLRPFGVWWAFDRLRIFANRHYSLLAIYAGDRLVHRTCIFPRYFRFPFMDADDLQIGDVWTELSHRGKGLAAAALQHAVQTHANSNSKIWYVVDDSNRASIKLAESAGFELVGRGDRKSRFAIRALGAYRLTKRIPAAKLSSKAA